MGLVAWVLRRIASARRSLGKRSLGPRTGRLGLDPGTLELMEFQNPTPLFSRK